VSLAREEYTSHAYCKCQTSNPAEQCLRQHGDQQRSWELVSAGRDTGKWQRTV